MQVETFLSRQLTRHRLQTRMLEVGGQAAEFFHKNMFQRCVCQPWQSISTALWHSAEAGTWSIMHTNTFLICCALFSPQLGDHRLISLSTLIQDLHLKSRFFCPYWLFQLSLFYLFLFIFYLFLFIFYLFFDYLLKQALFSYIPFFLCFLYAGMLHSYICDI